MSAAMGRPKLPDGEARKLFSIRLSEKEKAAFEKAAKAEKKSLSDWVRKTLTAASEGT
jgi:predicted HicB family RNase H-like nuclease